MTLSRSIIEPFLVTSTRRDLREKAFEAWTRRGENGGATDNRAIISEILALRDEQARILGYPSYADFKAFRRDGEDAGRGARAARRSVGRGPGAGDARGGGAARA